MLSHFVKSSLKTAAPLTLLLLGVSPSVGAAAGQFDRRATTATLPDGQIVPMWGYSCQPVAGSTATCAPLNPAAAAIGQWSPVVITVPANAVGGLQINLTNNLVFQPPTPVEQPQPSTMFQRRW